MAKNRKYIAFLRGINVGGNKLIKMEPLADAFRSAGFRQAKTYLASGNVILQSGSTKLSAMETKVEKRSGKSLVMRLPLSFFPWLNWKCCSGTASSSEFVWMMT